ncbi:uncharacterized protein At4g22758 [Nicotiana tabacum]|uniref:Uncharacterized protein At4g22758 n=2 Tax=Nicotiana TaxID=4085 RepID=A0A1S4D7Q7_TOBAC|nr:uncharacterized protein At4g22758-like [Nicotiana tomentosiformis]XP_009757100.1 PREDICTED: uncharacterized protein At4g22758-like [Nicotiana sylvestris]XP_016486237.1 PREDICTED: uncharacterized protein At4g22758-like [Nicotiana tabacum]XP_016509339.1 PREDICTED: uncharacterized protein At4g22758-like [Nicotiana tabacum]
MLLYKTKKIQQGKGNRLLISITVLGSAGPIRFVVKEEDLVADVINTALKNYAREGRLPVLGSDLNNFVLYCPAVTTEVLSPWETIGSVGVRNFVLFKKPQAENAILDGKQAAMARKRAASWKAWFNKSLTRKIVSY